jgi:hypothetical protein
MKFLYSSTLNQAAIPLGDDILIMSFALKYHKIVAKKDTKFLQFYSPRDIDEKIIILKLFKEGISK